MTEQQNTTTEAAIHPMTRKAADTSLAKRQISPGSHKAILTGELSLEEARDLGREGSPFAPANTTVSKTDRSRLCMCQCGRETKGRFAAGHDARVKGWIVRAVREGTLGELSEEIQEYAAERDLIRQTRERMAEEDRKRQEVATKKAEAQRREEGEAAKVKTDSEKS